MANSYGYGIVYMISSCGCLVSPLLLTMRAGGGRVDTRRKSAAWSDMQYLIAYLHPYCENHSNIF